MLNILIAIVRGDSGGPLFDIERQLLVGAVSFGPSDNCIDPDFPVVFSRIATEVSIVNFVVNTMLSSKLTHTLPSGSFRGYKILFANTIRQKISQTFVTSIMKLIKVVMMMIFLPFLS